LMLADLYDHRWIIETGYRDSDEFPGFNEFWALGRV